MPETVCDLSLDICQCHTLITTASVFMLTPLFALTVLSLHTHTKLSRACPSLFMSGIVDALFQGSGKFYFGEW